MACLSFAGLQIEADPIVLDFKLEVLCTETQTRPNSRALASVIKGIGDRLARDAEQFAFHLRGQGPTIAVLVDLDPTGTDPARDGAQRGNQAFTAVQRLRAQCANASPRLS